MEKIEAFVKAPWVPSVQVSIFDREKATQNAKGFNQRDPMLFTDGSARNDAVGIGVRWVGSLRWPDISREVATSEQLDPYAAELVALDSPVSYLPTSLPKDSTRSPITLFSDCKSALQALGNSYPKSGQNFSSHGSA